MRAFDCPKELGYSVRFFKNIYKELKLNLTSKFASF